LKSWPTISMSRFRPSKATSSRSLPRRSASSTSATGCHLWPFQTYYIVSRNSIANSATHRVVAALAAAARVAGATRADSYGGRADCALRHCEVCAARCCAKWSAARNPLLHLYLGMRQAVSAVLVLDRLAGSHARYSGTAAHGPELAP